MKWVFLKWKCVSVSSVSIYIVQVALVVKNTPANAGVIEDKVWSLDREDPQEEGMATSSSILVWRIPWTEEPGGVHTVHMVTNSWTQLKQFRIHAYIVQKNIFSIKCETTIQVNGREKWSSGYMRLTVSDSSMNISSATGDFLLPLYY